MELELKHLAPYLPYHLKVLGPNSKDDIRLLSPSSIASILDNIFGPQMKPILRPLSDLTKEDLIEELGTTIIHLDWVTNEREHFIRFYSLEHWLNNVPYEIYKYLIKNHFDVFGSIEKGLAIDINTIKQ